MNNVPKLAIIDAGDCRDRLEQGLQSLGVRHYGFRSADELDLGRGDDKPEVLVCVGDGISIDRRVISSARANQVPTLLVIPDASGIAGPSGLNRFDAWMLLDNLATEFLPRCRSLADPSFARASPSQDARFLSVIVHDLRTPLNVIGLTIRAIKQMMHPISPDIEEDLTFLHENAKQIETMLAQVASYSRLIEGDPAAPAFPFQPRRFLEDMMLDRQGQPASVRLEIDPTSPEEVLLDSTRVRHAIGPALANAASAAGEGGAVTLSSSGRPGWWQLDFVVDRPPPPTVLPLALSSKSFERLLGSPAERRGLDLAVASRVTETFGGTIELVIEPQVRSIIRINWPTNMA